MADKTPEQLIEERFGALDKQIANQDKSMSALTQKNHQLTEAVKTLSADLTAALQKLSDGAEAAAKNVSGLVTTVNSLQKENAALKKSLVKTGSTANDPAVEELPKTPDTVFQVGDNKYKFIAPAFRYKGERVTSKEALTDPEILQHLVDHGSSMIEVVL